jgi:hypothetical protein
MRTSKRYLALIICSCLAVSFIISLFLSVFLLYLPEKSSVGEASCLVIYCTSSSRICIDTTCTPDPQPDSNRKRACESNEYTCYDWSMEFKFPLDGTKYVASSSGGGFDECGNYPEGSTVPCYYNYNDPDNTVMLSATPFVAGGISAVVIFSVFSAISLIAIVYIACCST